MYEDKWTQREIRITRRDWTVATSINADDQLFVTVSSTAGWGNAGLRNFDRHVDVVKARVRRKVRELRPGLRFKLEVHSTHSWGNGVMDSITYAVKAV